MRYDFLLEYRNAGGINTKFSFYKLKCFVRQILIIYKVRNNRCDRG